jgi:hypothetical protein
VVSWNLDLFASGAHLVDRVIPPVPVRQWVLSLPYSLRFRAAFDADLLTEVLAIFVHEVFGSLRRRARDYGIPNGKCGAVTFVHRFGSALNLIPHFNLISIDGVYAAKDGEAPVFYALRPQANPAGAAQFNCRAIIDAPHGSQNNRRCRQAQIGLDIAIVDVIFCAHSNF